jgi:lipid A ethanolaminephosphotransferase
MQSIKDLMKGPIAVVSYLLKSKSIGMMSYWLLFVLWNILVYNGPLWLFAMGELNLVSGTSYAILVNIALLILFTTLVFLFPIGFLFPWVIKPLTLTLMVLNSVALYFITTYHVMFDQSMMGKLLNTSYVEAAGYYNTNIFAYIVLLGLLPAFLLSRYTIRPIIRLRLTVHTLFWIVVCVLTFYGTKSTRPWFDKHQAPLMGLALPGAYIIHSVTSFTAADPIVDAPPIIQDDEDSDTDVDDGQVTDHLDVMEPGTLPEPESESEPAPVIQ